MARTKTWEIGRLEVEQKDLEEQLSIKYFIKRFKKMIKRRLFNRENVKPIKSSPKERRKLDDDTGCFALRRTTSFAYLGLVEISSTNAPASVETDDRGKPEDENEFVEPKVIECDYCMKVFFSRIIYRRHALKHVKVIRCRRCNRPYKNIIHRRKHEMSCNKHYRI